MTVQIRQSRLRTGRPVSTILAPDLTLYTAGAIEVEAFGKTSQFFPSSFKLEWAGSVLWIDPVETGSKNPVDLILITHGHPDHFSPAEIGGLSGPDTVILCPVSIAARVKKAARASRVVVVEPGKDYSVGNFKIHASPAYSTVPVFLWLRSHPKSEGNVGYFIAREGFSVYHPGDTHLIPEHSGLSAPDVLFVPLDEENGKLTMDGAQATDLVRLLSPRIVIPMHYELGKGFPDRVLSGLDPAIDVRVLDGQD